MSNFIGMVFATLKKEGIDTSKMDTSEAIAKYNEIKGGEGGSNAKGEETPKQEEKTAETGKTDTEKTTNKKDADVENLSKETGLGYKDAEKMHKEIQEDDEAYSNFLNSKTEENRNDKYTTGNPDNINKQTTTANISNDLQNYKGSGKVDLILPGGKWIQIIPQKDDSYLVRSSNGQKYVGSVDDAKKEAIKSYGGNTNQNTATAEKMSTAMGISPDEAKAFVSGKGHLSNGGIEDKTDYSALKPTTYSNLQDDIWNKNYITEQIKTKQGDAQWQFIEDIMTMRHNQFEEFRKKNKNASYEDFVKTKSNLR